MGLLSALFGPPPPRLFFFHATGCSACEAAAPTIKLFARRNRGVRVVKIDITRWELPKGGWLPEVTPTYLLRAPDGRGYELRGAVTDVRELEEWIRSKLSR